MVESSFSLLLPLSPPFFFFYNIINTKSKQWVSEWERELPHLYIITELSGLGPRVLAQWDTWCRKWERDDALRRSSSPREGKLVDGGWRRKFERSSLLRGSSRVREIFAGYVEAQGFERFLLAARGHIHWAFKFNWDNNGFLIKFVVIFYDQHTFILRKFSIIVLKYAS